MQRNGPLWPRPWRTPMADHHTRHNPLGQDAQFATPASLMLVARLTPLEGNGWQVLRMLRSAEDISPLANLGQLRRYLTSTPLGQRAGYETAWRVLVGLRLTGLDQPGRPAPRASNRPCTQQAVSGLRKRPALPAGLRTRCQSVRASASLHRPRKQPGGSRGRQHSGNTSASAGSCFYYGPRSVPR